MKRISLQSIITIALISLISFNQVNAQSMHFSQYYNAPMLLNPANTALMSDYDYRVGTNFRNQWATIPVPYNTFSAFGDFQLFRKDEKNNWLGLGVAFFNDKAGDGALSLTRIEGFMAYHLGLSETSMLSVGLSGGSVQRSVNFGALTFDSQWDGFSFNGTLPNGEKNYVEKTNYYTIGAGLNYAYFPSENVYLKVGLGLANINQPKESFYNLNNQVDMRPTGNVELIYKANDQWTINPSMYYTTQSGAYELVFGSLFKANVNNANNNNSEGKGTQLILGAFNRLNESIIGVAGVDWNGLQIVGSYDFTISTLAPYTGGYGALELSVIYKGAYPTISHARGYRSTNCPRF